MFLLRKIGTAFSKSILRSGNEYKTGEQGKTWYDLKLNSNIIVE